MKEEEICKKANSFLFSPLKFMGGFPNGAVYYTRFYPTVFLKKEVAYGTFGRYRCDARRKLYYK
jgi:hypothetical protein